MNDARRAQLGKHAAPFLACLLGCSSDDAWLQSVTFQTFTDSSPKPSPDPLAKMLHGSLDEHAEELDRLNQAGSGIFVTVNGTDGKGRKKTNVRTLRGWHVDLDLKDATESLDTMSGLPLQPTMTVRTPGGWHLYWLALEPMLCDSEARRQEHEAELKAIATTLKVYGGDPKAATVERVLRVSGFFHRKGDSLPVRLLRADGPRYAREQIRAAFPPVAVAPKTAASQGHAPLARPSDRAEVLRRAGFYLDTQDEAIQGENGSGTTFNAALKLIDGYDLTEDEALSLLLDRYNPRCVPPWSVEELRHKVQDAAKHCQNRGHLLKAEKSKHRHQTLAPDENSGDDALPSSHEPPEMPPAPEEDELQEQAGKPSQATKALNLAKDAGVEAWMDEAGVAYLTVPAGGHVEHHRLKSDPDSPAARWLARLFYRQEGRALSSSAKKDALENLIAEATSADRIFPTARRVYRHGDRVFLDLCSPGWEVVEVSAHGWAIRPAAEVPIRFTRAQAMQAIPTPIRGGQVADLKPFFHCDEDDFRLVVAWVLAALSGGREYPILCFGGEPGSAKSTATSYARTIIDPNSAPLRKTPKEERDLFIAAGNAFVLTFDNLSAPPDWLPDALCALALGTGYAVRSLYTDDGETVFRVASPCIVNGISEQLTRSDLADRALSVTLHRIDQTEMKPKDELDAAFSAALPGVLGAFLDVLSTALANLPHVRLDRLPRLAQTAKLMAAAEAALGWEPGTFMRLFDRAQESVAANVGEGDPVAQGIQELAKRNAGRWRFKGTATELRGYLEAVKPAPLPPVWPPAANKLGERLRRLAPTLRLMGWKVNPDGKTGGRNNTRFIELAYPAPLVPTLPPFSLFEEKEEPSLPSYRPQSSNDAVLGEDGSFGSTVLNRPSYLSAKDDPNVRTIAQNQSSDREPALTLAKGRSDDSNGQKGKTYFEGSI